jgi:hypothetical protein
LLLQTTSFSNDKSAPIEVTPAIEKKLNQEITNEAGLLKTKLSHSKAPAISIEFELLSVSVRLPATNRTLYR